MPFLGDMLVPWRVPYCTQQKTHGEFAKTAQGNWENGLFHGEGTLTYGDPKGPSSDFRKDFPTVFLLSPEKKRVPGTPGVLFFKATLPPKPATIALKIGHLALQVGLEPKTSVRLWNVATKNLSCLFKLFMPKRHKTSTFGIEEIRCSPVHTEDLRILAMVNCISQWNLRFPPQLAANPPRNSQPY